MPDCHGELPPDKLQPDFSEANRQAAEQQRESFLRLLYNAGKQVTARLYDVKRWRCDVCGRDFSFVELFRDGGQVRNARSGRRKIHLCSQDCRLTFDHTVLMMRDLLREGRACAICGMRSLRLGAVDAADGWPFASQETVDGLLFGMLVCRGCWQLHTARAVRNGALTFGDQTLARSLCAPFN
jgi:hypothetical protein